MHLLDFKNQKMEAVLNKKNRPKPKPEFIVLNEFAQVFCGLRGGYPEFSDDFDSAKPLERDEQVKMIQQGTSFKLEKYFL
jgi:hypothetical protein